MRVRLLNLDVETMPGGTLGVIYEGRSVCIFISHVGIDGPKYRQLTQTADVQAQAQTIK